MIQIRSLVGISFEKMTEAFNDAFSDYDIPAKYSSEYLTDLVIRRGYRPDLAVGAFDDDRLVGFVFNCLDGDAAYNGGTGVVISHRRRGIARQLMQRSIETLPVRRYILEVIDTNTRAAALYRELGFVETRQLQSWKYVAPTLLSVPAQAGVPVPQLHRLRAWCDMTPSWQNDVPSIQRAREPYLILGDADAGAVVFPSNGDVALLAVKPEARHHGRGRALLAEIAKTVGKPLRIMNVDTRDDGIAEFLAACGAKPMVAQLEMACLLG
ncbi:MAG TPA: GNAT family N-acetyltransferase [Thermoanaerobaculia bacterium]